MKKRVLQIVPSLGVGGIESYLVHLLRHIDRSRVSMDFLTHVYKPGPFAEQIEALGSPIFCCPLPGFHWGEYFRALRRLFLRRGPYDVVHCHLQHFNGVVLWQACRAGIPVRIAHSHLARSPYQARTMWKPYFALMKWLMRCYATAVVAVSREAAAALLGPKWAAYSRGRVLHCGIDLDPFHVAVSRAEVRAAMSIPEEAFVLGHIGRFTPEKNHAFLLRVFAEVIRSEPKARLLLVGDGPTLSDIREQARAAGLGEQVYFAGARLDIATLLRGAMDVFLLPSQREGLGLALLEAQAAALTCFVADTVPCEATVISPLVQRLSLADTPALWAEAILRQRDQARAISPDDALSRIAASDFDIKNGVREVERLYQLDT